MANLTDWHPLCTGTHCLQKAVVIETTDGWLGYGKDGSPTYGPVNKPLCSRHLAGLKRSNAGRFGRNRTWTDITPEYVAVKRAEAAEKEAIAAVARAEAEVARLAAIEEQTIEYAKRFTRITPATFVIERESERYDSRIDFKVVATDIEGAYPEIRRTCFTASVTPPGVWTSGYSGGGCSVGGVRTQTDMSMWEPWGVLPEYVAAVLSATQQAYALLADLHKEFLLKAQAVAVTKGEPWTEEAHDCVPFPTVDGDETGAQGVSCVFCGKVMQTA
jgi:hypothetical protein